MIYDDEGNAIPEPGDPDYPSEPGPPPPPITMPPWATDEAFKKWYLLQSADNIWPAAAWTQADLDRLTAAYTEYEKTKTTTGGGGGGTADPTSILTWLKEKGSLTAGLLGLKDDFAKQFSGWSIVSNDTVRGPDGQDWDVIVNFGGADPSWGWNLKGGPATGGGATGGFNYQQWLASLPGNFYEPPAPFEYPEFAPPEFDTPGFNAPAPFDYPEFVGPNAETFQTDPGYEFRSKEGLRALENTASAQGVLRTGGTLKGLIDWSQGLASQEFGNVWNRAYTGWQGNRSAAGEDYDRLWNNLIQDYMIDYNTEADEYNRALSSWNANLGKAATGYGFTMDAAAAKAGGQQNVASLGLQGLGGQSNMLLSLYDLSTRNLPTYTPTSFPSSFTG